MKIKSELLLLYLKNNEMAVGELARQMATDLSEIEKLLCGEAVGVRTARNFIGYFGAAEAQRIIDWDAMDRPNPLARDCRTDIKGETERG